MPSWWHDRRPDGALTPEPRAELHGSWDVVVVGGGLTGMTTALLLARAGKSVVVVEAREVGAGTTGGSTAKVSLLQGTRLSRIARRHPSATVREYVRANREAQAWVERYCADHGVAVQSRPACTYTVTEEGVSTVRAEYDAARGAGLDVGWAETTTLPFPTTAAVVLPDQLQLDPLDLLAALTRDATSRGVAVVEGARAQRVAGRGPLRVHTTAGEAEAGTVVVATTLPFLDRGGFFARATAERSYCHAFATPTAAVDGMYLGVDSPTRSLREAPAEDGSVLLVGGGGHPTGRAGSPAEHAAELRTWAERHFPEARLIGSWSAQDYATATGLPWAGPVLPGRDDLLVAGGYAKWGMTNGVAAALALASRILGGRTDWAATLQTWSPAGLRAVPDAARINAEVGLHLARGWLTPLTRLGSGPDPEEGQGQVRADHAGTPTAVCRADGLVHRLSAVCTHLGGIVSWNDAERSWDCPLHGSRFAASGEVLEGPATTALEPRAPATESR